MQRLDLKLQNDFATRYSSKVVNQPLPQTNIKKMSGQSVFPVQNVGKTPGSMEYASRIFSPYLTPSAIHTENRQISQGSVAPIYRHNIAATKYFNISITPRPRLDLSTNLIA
jgi:hypothetical protein